MSQSLLGKALGLRPGQRVVIEYDPQSGVVVSGVNDTVRQIVAEQVGYDALGRLRLDPESYLRQTGAQFVLRQD